ncbi:tetratricopeptide repeat protein [Pseudoalteromonas sp. G4]|uniref:tetratricopeptide repeat protein n=1 Tax=Pseudoalteromonas sp. G4 TaxID=2992761 RepID=UPI00237ECE06|nr:tetratricopeptide repeat protein [Pseudoalteromonas sp. G4]MDE3273999.1 sel1 repeat family protein [Pseudoalteromonas sp. G4]
MNTNQANNGLSMLFFNVKDQAFEHDEYLQCCQCNQRAVSAKAKLKFLCFGLIPILPFKVDRESYCANCDCKNLPENSLSSQVPPVAILTKFIGLLLLIAFVSWQWQKHVRATEIELDIVNNPQSNDFFFFDYSKLLNEGYYQKRVVAAKVIASENDTVTLQFSRYNYSRERDLEISARSDNFVQKGYFFTESKDYPQQQINAFFKNGTIYAAYRPNAMKLFGGFVVMPSNPKPLYDGFQLNKANQEGIAYYQEKEFTLAFESFKQAAEQGDDWGQLNLAKMYLDGEGTKVNKEQAAFWLMQAVNKGNHNAKLLCQETQLCAELEQ